jgi:proline iminopeptidase
MNELYPAIEPFSNGMLDVDPMHSIYFEQCGNPDGEPVLFIHGGPGAGCSARDRRFFDPDHFHIVLVDQRGAGRSKPVGETRNNTSDLLVADFETLRVSLGIDRWHVFGGSWGSTLGLYYAQSHPDRCLSLILRGIWLFREQDLEWFLYQMQFIQPERWRTFAEVLAPADRDDLLEGYWQLLNGPDRDRALAAARAWSEYEIMSCTLLPNPEFAAMFEDDDAAWSLARLEAHFFRNQRFEPDGLLLQQVDRIREIPGFIVHGRYDVLCPVKAADELHRAWPETRLSIVEDAGHSSIEPGITSELVGAMDRVRDTGSPA